MQRSEQCDYPSHLLRLSEDDENAHDHPLQGKGSELSSVCCQMGQYVSDLSIAASLTDYRVKREQTEEHTPRLAFLIIGNRLSALRRQGSEQLLKIHHLILRSGVREPQALFASVICEWREEWKYTLEHRAIGYAGE